MRWAEGLARQAVECRFLAEARILIMKQENVLNLRSFLQIQIIGWYRFYLFDPRTAN